jgi:hypothetical protein
MARFMWVNDPVMEETFIWPRRFARDLRKAGPVKGTPDPRKRVLADCASVNAILISLLGAIGIRAAFVFVGDGVKERGEHVVYHVFTVIRDFDRSATDKRVKPPLYLEPTIGYPAGEADQYPKMIVENPYEGY